MSPGRRQRGVAHVVLEVEVRVVDPHRAPEVHRHEADPLAVAGHQRQLRREQRDQVVVGGCRSLEHRARRDVHVRRAVLEVEELCVERVHVVHGAPPFIESPQTIRGLDFGGEPVEIGDVRFVGPELDILE